MVVSTYPVVPTVRTIQLFSLILAEVTDAVLPLVDGIYKCRESLPRFHVAF